ncbi:SAPS-domain-containing protein, partial [Backusella circina FSU 941]
MFWRFGSQNTNNAFDTLLERPDITLEEVLLEDQIIQEAQSGNQKLIDFLSKYDHLSEIVNLFFSLNMNRQKLPLVASELLASDIPALTEKWVLRMELVEKFWNYLDMPFSNDPVSQFQATYFCKIIRNLLMRYTTKMVTFIKLQPENLKKILNHLHSAPILDLLLILIRLEELPDIKGIIKWLTDNGLLTELMHRLDPNLDQDDHLIAQQCIVEIVRMSQTTLTSAPSIGANDFIIGLASKENMELFVFYMLEQDGPNINSSFVNSVTIIIDIIRNNNSGLEDETATVFNYTPPISLVPLLETMTENIPKFVHLLKEPRSKGSGLGFERLKVCELFAELLHCSNMIKINATDTGDKMKRKWIECDVLPICIDLFFGFPLNNFLHYIIYDMIHQLFNSPMKETNRELVLTLFNQAKLTDRIIEAQKKNDEACEKAKGMRLGYMGHITFIADEIVKLFQGYPEAIEIAVESDLEAWYNFCKTSLKETKERDQRPFGHIIDHETSEQNTLNDESTSPPKSDEEVKENVEWQDEIPKEVNWMEGQAQQESLSA